MSTFEWENEYPNQCPPNSANSQRLSDVYRLIPSSPIVEIHFHPNNKTFGQKSNKKNCRHWGISFQNSIAGINRLRSAIPAFRKFLIARGVIEQNHGVWIQDANHINLWRYGNINISNSFRIIP